MRMNALCAYPDQHVFQNHRYPSAKRLCDLTSTGQNLKPLFLQDLAVVAFVLSLCTSLYDSDAVLAWKPTQFLFLENVCLKISRGTWSPLKNFKYLGFSHTELGTLGTILPEKIIRLNSLQYILTVWNRTCSREVQVQKPRTEERYNCP